MPEIDPKVRTSDALVNKEIRPLPFEIQSPDDYHRLRDTWNGQTKIPKLIDVEGGRPVEAGQQFIRIMLSGDESAGAMQVSYDVLQPGTAVPGHYQPYEDELFFVVDGEIEITVGNQTKVLRKGGFGYAPRNTTHAFRNVSEKPASMFTLNTPAGHERGFLAAARVMKHGGDANAVMTELRKHDFIFHEQNLDLG